MPIIFNPNKKKGVFMIPSGATKSPTPVPTYANTYSMNFDGIDDYIDCGSSTDLNPTTAYTISAWVKRSGTGLQTIFSNGKNAANQGGIILWSVSDKLKLYHFDISTWRVVESNVATTNGVWYNVIATWDGSIIKMYINGVLQTSTFSTSNLTYGTTSQNTFIGNYNSIEWNGNIDEVAIWDNEQSVSNIWDGSGSPISLSSTNPKGWWRMGEKATWTTLWTLTDQGSSGSNATSQNMAEADRETDIP